MIPKPGPGQRWRCSRFDGGSDPAAQRSACGRGPVLRGAWRARAAAMRGARFDSEQACPDRARPLDLPRTTSQASSDKESKLPRTTSQASPDNQSRFLGQTKKLSFLGKQTEPPWAMNRASSSNKPSLLGQPIKLPRTSNQASPDNQSSFLGQAIKLLRTTNQASSDNQSGVLGPPGAILGEAVRRATCGRPSRGRGAGRGQAAAAAAEPPD